MSEDYNSLLAGLNHKDVKIRLYSLKCLKDMEVLGKIKKPVQGVDVNNHIHTDYSFSPYSPSKAIWMAYSAGLCTAGIMDHDSVSGALEFIEAGKITGTATTIGMECRMHFNKTPLSGRRINHPDQHSVIYAALHGIPHTQINTVKDFILPYLVQRDKRNIEMTDKLNSIIKPFDLQLDYIKDIVSLSKRDEAGSVTERHILYALSLKLIEKFSKGAGLVSFIREKLKLPFTKKIEDYLLDIYNPFYEYDLLGVLKAQMSPRFYIDADKECMDASEFISLANHTGSIAAYAYLGDIGDCLTGDKQSLKFEDDFLDLVFDVIRELGFHAVTYMPSRNTLDQVRRVKSLCERYGFFQISGEDINSPRQSFICEALKNPEFENLIDSTWALIGHEKAATIDLLQSFISKETLQKYPIMESRVKAFKEIGLRKSLA